MTSDQYTEDPVVGKDIPWNKVEGELLRVDSFTLFATVNDMGRVEASPIPMPYALLRLGSPNLGGTLLMPVNHRLDFLNFYDIERGAQVPDGYDLLVCWLPYRGFLGPLIRLFGPPLHLFGMPPSRARELFERRRDLDQASRRALNRVLFAGEEIMPRICFTCTTKLYSFQTRCNSCHSPYVPLAD